MPHSGSRPRCQRLLLLSLLCATTALLAGCASLSRNECQAGDWRGIGREDGGHGETAARLEEHREACREYGIAPNPAEWEWGRQEGLLSYCQPDNGYAEGAAGRTYRYVCPPHLAPAFERQYRHGQRIYEIKQRIERIDSDLRGKRNALEKLEKSQDKDADERRRRLYREISELETQRAIQVGTRIGIEMSTPH